MKDYYDHIEDYLKGKLNAEDRTDFETQIKSDPKLKEALLHFNEIKKFSAALIEDETRQSIQQLKDHKQSRISKIRIILIILTVLTLLLIWFVSKPIVSKGPDSEQILASLYEPPPLKATRNDVPLSTPLDSAIRLYENGNLSASQNLLESHYTIDPSSTQAIRYLGYIQLTQSNYSESEKYFNELLLKGSDSQIDEAKYNLIIIYLVLKQKGKADLLYQQLKVKNVLSQEKMNRIEEIMKAL